MLKKRIEIINIIGQEYFDSNIENDEFNYAKAIKIPPTIGHYKLDLRFEKDNYSIIIETKNNVNSDFSQKEIDQIMEYFKLERMYRPNNKIIAILFNFKNQNIKVWKDDIELNSEERINSMDYYISLFNKKINNKESVITTTNNLNSFLHSIHIPEKQRSQFIGSLLIALNNGLAFDTNLTTKEIIGRIKEKLESKIDNDENKKLKTDLLIKILNNQDIREIKSKDFCRLLNILKDSLIPSIDSKTPTGEDLLNLFFTTFNKYVGKADKNQAFTPTHITDFMAEIVDLSKHSKVLDPTCGSGSFLVQAMSKMLSKAENDEKARSNIKKNQIFGIEREEHAFGLATTNMLIHEDGKTNIINKSCFDSLDWIQSKDIDIVLMNPPFNGQKMPKDCPVKSKTKMDATKGLYFVKFVADTVNKGRLATILPLQCAMNSDKEISKIKKEMLAKHTLKAVFSMHDEIFHPGASVNTCVMLFELGKPHNSDIPTFFGYFKEDGFVKKKNKGRIEKTNWEITKNKWLELFHSNKEEAGISVLKKITANDEWLAEAYMETDYSTLKEEDFIQTIREFIAFKVKNGKLYEK